MFLLIKSIDELQRLTLLFRRELAVLEDAVALLPAPMLQFNQGIQGVQGFAQLPAGVQLPSLLGFFELLTIFAQRLALAAFHEVFYVPALVDGFVESKALLFNIGAEFGKAGGFFGFLDFMLPGQL